MNRGAFERRFSRLDDAIKGLRFNRQLLLIGFATSVENDRFLELLGKLKGRLRAKTAQEEITEISALFETWEKRLRARLGRD